MRATLEGGVITGTWWLLITHENEAHEVRGDAGHLTQPPNIQPCIKDRPGPFDSAESFTHTQVAHSFPPSVLPPLLALISKWNAVTWQRVGNSTLKGWRFSFPGDAFVWTPLLVIVRSCVSPHRSAHCVTLKKRPDREMDGRQFLRVCFIKLMPNVVFTSTFLWKAGFKHSFYTLK